MHSPTTTRGALRQACARAANSRGPTAGHAPGYMQANLMIVPQARRLRLPAVLPAQPQAVPADRGAAARRARAARARPARTSPPTCPATAIYRDGEFVERARRHRRAVARRLRELPDRLQLLVRVGAEPRPACRCATCASSATSPCTAPTSPARRAGPIQRRDGGQHAADQEPRRRQGGGDLRPLPAGARRAGARRQPARARHRRPRAARTTATPSSILDDEVPVFWACGVTPQWVAQRSRLPLCITHAPGKMFVTDLKG